MRNKLTCELAVCGYNAVSALGQYHPERINRLFLRQDRFESFTTVCGGLAERRRPYKVCGDEELERICKSTHHQGVVAMIYEPEIQNLSGEDLTDWARGGKTGLVLHEVGNDNNLGAVIRSAAFFDGAYIVISTEDPEARLTTSAYRVAEGGMEHVTIRGIRNTAAFLRAASRSLLVIGADHRARFRLRDLPRIAADKQQALPRREGRPGIVLVLGNEERGLPGAVKENCGALVRIPGTGLMESLNVAQAAALFLEEIYEL
ncbi:MAG: RNA methyltransferase [Treponema sp.]|jgi:TrmH RNA methyltransferase|nr:RNA methyltransferase [Treponema sp.]